MSKTEPPNRPEDERNQLRTTIEIYKDTPHVHSLLRRFRELTRQIVQPQEAA